MELSSYNIFTGEYILTKFVVVVIIYRWALDLNLFFESADTRRHCDPAFEIDDRRRRRYKFFFKSLEKRTSHRKAKHGLRKLFSKGNMKF